MATAAPRPPQPLTGAKLVIGTVALSLATFMNVLDTSIANVSIPAISGDLGVAPNQGTWVITSFAVANAISVPLTGWLTQRFGQVRLFVTSVLLFVLASWACGMAPNMATLELAIPDVSVMGKAKLEELFFESGFTSSLDLFNLSSGIKGWLGHMKIPLDKIGLSSGKLTGSKFAVCRYNYNHLWVEGPEISSTSYFPAGGFHQPGFWQNII